MEVQHVGPSSWQPLLCVALLDELHPLCSEADGSGDSFGVFSYLSGRRGRAILEILALAQWKGLPNAGDFLRALTKAWKFVFDHFMGDAADESTSEIDLQEFDVLLLPDCDDFLPSADMIDSRCGRHRCEYAGGNYTPRRRMVSVRRKKRRELDELRVSTSFSSSDDERLKNGSSEIGKDRRRRRQLPALLLGYPVVQEDSDGFPACWCDNVLSTIPESARMNVDDIVLPMIRASLPRKLKLYDDEPAIILVLLACLIRKVLPFLSDNDDRSAVWKFVEVFLSSCGDSGSYGLHSGTGMQAPVDCLPRVASSESISTLKKELLVQRHGIRALLPALTILKAHPHCEMIVRSANFLLDSLKIVCQSLSAAPQAMDYFELLRAERCMEYLLEMAADIVTGVFRIIAYLTVSASDRLRNGEASATASFVLDLCKKAFLDEMVRDVCIGLDLLATVDQTGSTATPDEIELEKGHEFGGDTALGYCDVPRVRETPRTWNPKPYLDNVYHGKLYSIFVHIVAAINALQQLRSIKAHVTSCVKFDHRFCRVSCLGYHHTDSSEFRLAFNPNDVSPLLSRSSKCSVAFLEKIIFTCLRNVTGWESKQMCIEALESIPSCCCISKVDLLALLLDVLADVSSVAQRRDSLLKCFMAKLAKEGSCSRKASWQCQFCCPKDQQGRRYSMEEASAGISGSDQISIAWRRFEGNAASNGVERMVWGLLWRIFPSTSDYFKDEVACAMLIPSLSKWCQDHTEFLKLTHSEIPGDQLHLYSSLIQLCEMAVQSPRGYNELVEKIFGYADLLFDHPDTRALFLRFSRRIAIVEWDVLGAGDHPAQTKRNEDFQFNRFLFNKFYLIGKLILKDTPNFVSDTAWEFWMTSALLMETCALLLSSTKSSNSFRLIFTDFGGFQCACRIVEAAAQHLFPAGSPVVKSEMDEKSSHRLAQLFTDAFHLCLISGASEEKMTRVFAVLRSIISHSSVNGSGRSMVIFVARRLMDAAFGASGGRDHTVSMDQAAGRQHVQEAASFSCTTLSDEAKAVTCKWTSDPGYDADAESNLSHLCEDRPRSAETMERFRFQARLCVYCLELLGTVTSGSESAPKESTSCAVLLNRLYSFCSKQTSFTKLMIEEGCINALFHLAQFSSDGCLQASLKLIFQFFKWNPQAGDLTQVTRRFSDSPGVFQDMVIDCFAAIISETQFEPSSYLVFPRPLSEDAIEKDTVKRQPATRSRSVSPRKAISVSRAAEGARTASVSSVSPFAPLLSGLSSLFTFGGNASKKQASGGKDGPQSNLHTDKKAANKRKTLGDDGTSAFTLWPDAAIALAVDEAAKCSLRHGVSVGLWIYVERVNGNIVMDAPLHMLTIGDVHVACSVYVQGKTLLVQLRSGDMMLAKYTRTKFVPLEKWTHILLVIALSGTEELTVKVLCDGARQCVWNVPFNSNEMKATSAPCVCFGAASRRAESSARGYRLGNVAGFRGELSLEHSIVLRALGPRCITVCDTKSRRLDGDLASFINAGLLLSREKELKIGALLEDRLGLLEQLQKSQAFVFASADADRVTFYWASTALPGHDDGDLCRRVPFTKQCKKQTTIESNRKFTIDDALTSLGGAIECARPEECQANALKLVLKTASRNPEWWRVFLDLRGYVVLSRILSTSCCQRGFQLLEVIFDFTISGDRIQWPTVFGINIGQYSSSSSLLMDVDYWKRNVIGLQQAVIQDPFGLTCFLLEPDIWKNDEVLIVWETAMEVIARLISETAPILAAFNICQLNRAKFLKNLFFFLTERLQDPVVRLTSSIACTVSQIAGLLVGSPPSVSELTVCWDFVFLTHPASSTYLNYRISGPSEWLDPDVFVEPLVRLDNYESTLCTKLRQVMNSRGKDEFIIWITSEDWYSQRTADIPGKMAPPTLETGSPVSASSTDAQIASTSNTQQPQQLPDLVCDIDTSVAAGEMSDSMRTATQSNVATDDEVFPADEYLDAQADGGDGRNGRTRDAPWLLETRSGLFGLVCLVLANTPDAIVHPIVYRIIGSVVKWEHLLVMLRRQSNANVRISCIRALCILLERASVDQRLQFLKANGFALLANQLKEYPCPAETVEDLFSLLCGDTVKLEYGLGASHLSAAAVGRFRAGVVKPLLVAYQNSVEDVSLFWNMSTAFCRAFQCNGAFAQAMLESHVCEVLANILVQLSLQHHREIDVSGMSEHSLMTEGWRSLASAVLHRCVTRSNIHHHQGFCELLQLIYCAAITTTKLGIEAHTLVRRELCFLIQLALESVRQLYDDANPSPFPALLPSYSSIASTPLQSGRETPLQFGERAHGVLASSRPGRAPRRTVPSISGFSNVSETRRSSLSGSFNSLKERLFSISQGNLSDVSSNESEKLSTQSEILEKWKMLLQYSMEYFMFFSANDSSEEHHLFDYLLHFALSTLANESNVRKRGNTWHSLMWSSRTKLQQFLSHCLIFLMYPAERHYCKLSHAGGRRAWPVLDEGATGEWFRRRLLIAEAWAHESLAKSQLKYVLDSIAQCQSVVTSTLYELLLCEYDIPDSDVDNCQKLLKLLAQIKAKSPFDEYDNADEIVHNVCWDERTTLEIYIGLRAKWFERMKNFSTRLRSRSQSAAQALSDDAMAVTCTVVGEQNLPRKLFIQLKKQAANDSLMAEEVLRRLATDLCHPAGPCFHSSSWPVNWCLDPTEGPNRERRRLMPAHLNVPEKFLLSECRDKQALSNEIRPLVKLLSGVSPDNVAVSTIAGQLLERLRIEDKIIFNCPAVVIRTSYECDGELLVGDRALYFVGERSRSSQKGLPLDSVISMNWPYSTITALHRRYFQLIDLALEIFFTDGETYLIAFETKEKRELFINRLSSMELPNLATYSDHLLQTLTAWWREGNITNFQYLMQLNTLAGRTFNDLMQYPVFPFVLSDCSSMTLNLNSPVVYRNLAKPIAIQDLQMESHYVHVYRSLESDIRRNGANLSSADSMPLIGAYHYGSHYSNSGIVAHYLVRLPPFTQLVLEYQDNNFDLPDRTFHSISTAYRLSSAESTTDFKELIPEFFFLSEFLINREGLNLGRRQNGQSISDVDLPPWCPNADPRLFILVHRQALESASVSAHLHEWVDLILGYKQTGQAAIDAINVFHPATYHGTLSAAADSDEIRLKALNTMVKTYGQMPKQLFKAPHLPHLIAQNYLALANQQQPQSPIFSVHGVRWGHYVGSPELPEPSLVLKQRHHGFANMKPVHLTALADGSCVGYPNESMPLAVYGSVKKDLWLANVREVERIFVVCWGFGDKIVRLRSVFPPDTSTANWTNVIAFHDDEVTSNSNCPGLSVIMFGLKTGVVLVYKMDLGNEGLKSCLLVRSLYGHRSAVTAIDTCSDYSVFVTGSENGECFVWDFNKLSLVLVLRKHGGPVTHVCVSKTTCEIATIASKGWGSELVLHTVNGRVIGSIETDIVITSVAMSSAPEGTAVNCIAAGMQNGMIRLWNMWTLAPIREIFHSHFLEPITSLTFTHNSLKLYACTKSGAVLCWDSGSSKQIRPPRFFCVNPHQ